MTKFFMTSKFGKAIKDRVQKTKKRQQGQSVYRVKENMSEYGLRRGDQLYLDAKHKDHLEVFHKDGSAKTVLNLDGTENFAKAAALTIGY